MAITISTILQLKVACVYARPCTLAGYKDEGCSQIDSEVAALGVGASVGASASVGTYICIHIYLPYGTLSFTLLPRPTIDINASMDTNMLSC